MVKHPGKDDIGIKLPDFATKTDLIEYFGRISTERPLFINTAITAATADLSIADIVNRFSNGVKFKTNFIKSIDGITKFNVLLRSQREDIKHKNLDFYVISEPYLFIFIAIADPTSWGEVIIRFIRDLFPYIFQPFLKQQELKELLVQAQKTNLVDILIKTIASKRWCISGGKKGIASRRDWLPSKAPITVEDAFIEAEEESKWFKQLTFEVKMPTTPLGKSAPFLGKITKDGQLSFSNEFDIFWRSFVKPISKIAVKRLRKFLNKSRESTPQHTISPITIEYDHEYFKDMKQRKAFVELVKEMPKISYSVLHANPHIHISILDYIDGSAVDLWILSSKKLTLIPQIKTSEASLNRIVNYISERFYEGEVVVDSQ